MCFAARCLLLYYELGVQERTPCVLYLVIPVISLNGNGGILPFAKKIIIYYHQFSSARCHKCTTWEVSATEWIQQVHQKNKRNPASHNIYIYIYIYYVSTWVYIYMLCMYQLLATKGNQVVIGSTSQYHLIHGLANRCIQLVQKKVQIKPISFGLNRKGSNRKGSHCCVRNTVEWVTSSFPFVRTTCKPIVCLFLGLVGNREQICK